MDHMYHISDSALKETAETLGVHRDATSFGTDTD